MLPLIEDVYMKSKYFKKYVKKVVDIYEGIKRDIEEIEKRVQYYDELINTIYSKSKTLFAREIWKVIKHSDNTRCIEICWAGMYDERYADKCYEECRNIPLEMYKEAKKEFEESVKKLKEIII